MKLLEQIKRVGRQMRLADRTIEAYSYWIRRYLAYSAARFGGWKRPEELFTKDLEHFLSHLVLDKRLSASSQNQALNAIVFLYRRVLQDAISPGINGDATCFHRSHVSLSSRHGPPTPRRPRWPRLSRR